MNASTLPMRSSIRQIDGLQMLRAVAVLLVVWCHTGQHLEAYHGRKFPGLNVFGIDIFFVISGFILSLVVLRNRGVPGPGVSWDFLKRRFIRVYPIYWVFAGLILLRKLHAGEIAGHNYWSAFFLLPPIHYQGDGLIIGYSWTMMFEIFFYSLLGLILLRTVRWAVPTLILVLTASVVLGSLWDIRHPFWIVAANPILLEFVFGALIAVLYARVGVRRPMGMFLTAFGVFASLWMAAHNPYWIANGGQMILINQGAFYRAVTWGGCALFLVAGVVFWSPSMHRGPARWWVIMGNASYSTYIVSELVLEFASRAFFHFHPNTGSLFVSGLFMCAMLAATLVVGYASYLFIEKPMLDVLQRRFLNKGIHPGGSGGSRSPTARHIGDRASLAPLGQGSGDRPLASAVSTAIPVDEPGERHSQV